MPKVALRNIFDNGKHLNHNFIKNQLFSKYSLSAYVKLRLSEWKRAETSPSFPFLFLATMKMYFSLSS